MATVKVRLTARQLEEAERVRKFVAGRGGSCSLDEAVQELFNRMFDNLLEARENSSPPPVPAGKVSSARIERALCDLVPVGGAIAIADVAAKVGCSIKDVGQVAYANHGGAFRLVVGRGSTPDCLRRLR